MFKIKMNLKLKPNIDRKMNLNENEKIDWIHITNTREIKS